MIKRKIKLTIPQYRERKEIFDEIGYKETAYFEKGSHAIVHQEIDENGPHFLQLRKFEKTIYRKGPTFVPIILFVIIAFVLLSVFVLILAEEKSKFDVVTNSLSFLLPAFSCLLADVIYTYFYFTINRQIIERGNVTKEEILKSIREIKSK